MAGDRWDKFDTLCVWFVIIGCVLLLIFGNEQEKEFAAGLLFLASLVSTMYFMSVSMGTQLRDNCKRAGHAEPGKKNQNLE